MRPSTVLFTLGVLMSFTSMQYYFLVPKDIQINSKSDNNAGVHSKNIIGYWGTPNAEFDWCEYNHLWSPFIAEPMNTLTSVFYSIGAYIAWQDVQPFARYTSLTNINWTLIIVFFIGVGSTLFHATLQFKMQLMDEFPMYCVVTHISGVFYTRKTANDRKLSKTAIAKRERKKLYLNCIQWFVCYTLFVISWFTDRESMVHIITRGILTVSFSLYFLYVFLAGAKIANEVSDYALLQKNGHRHSICDTYFDRAFISFVIAIICWLADNWYCNIFQNLMIPYINLHAFGWHIFTALGMYYFGLVVLSHQLIIEEGVGDCILYNNRRCYGIFPCFVIANRKQARKKKK